jgi:hypothetical protein
MPSLPRLKSPLLPVLLFSALALQCGGGVPVLSTGTTHGELSGRVIKGPLNAGTVTAYRVDATLRRGAALGSASTDEAGAFTISLPAWNGPLLLVASSGTYLEEAVGLPVKLDGNELLALVPDYQSGAKLSGLRVTPVSTWAVGLAAFHCRGSAPDAGPEVLTGALAEAFTHLHAHLGELDWRSVTPADLTTAQTVSLSPEARAGLVLAALSFRARLTAEGEGATPGVSVNAATLTTALLRDAADGTFDGVGQGGPLVQLNTRLSGETLRQGLAQAMAAFIASDRNGSSLKLADIQPFAQSLATARDPWLFCPGQQAGCAKGSTDVEPPVVTFLKPVDGSGVNGTVSLQVRAEDGSKLKGFAFTAPAQLLTLKPALEPSGTVATLSGTLDVSALPEGPLKLEVHAEDESGNVAVGAITVAVANQVPGIAFTSPADGSTVKDTVLIAASASSQNGSITRLELVDPPPGVGPDTLPEAGALAATWNTRAVPEGLTSVTLRATNSLGAFADKTVAVLVDNVPFGTVSATVSAGAPVAGATVKLVAIDDLTGLPVTGRTGGAVLGTGGPTALDGTVTFTLSQENWDGPVQVVASGNGLTFVDPSDGATQVSIPATFEFTSTLARYKTGDALSAPLTLWTTLADVAARAYAKGKNPAAPGARPLSAALAVVDPLFASHLSRPTPWALRAAMPVLLTSPPTQSLRDVVYAALPDVALNQMARTVSLEGGVSAGQVVTAITLTQLLSDDAADGLLDGLAGAAPLRTAGLPPYVLDANTTRFKQAIELDRFIRGTENRTGLSRVDLQNAAVLDNISGDASILYPAAQPPIPFDNQPPAVAFTVSFEAADGSTGHPPVGAEQRVAGRVTVSADATDLSGVQSLEVRVGGALLAVAQGNTAAHFVGSWLTNLDGPLTFQATAHDKVGNSGTTDFSVTVDNTPPTVSVVQPAAGFYSQALSLEASATDASGVALLEATGLSGFVDQDAQSSRVFGSWAIPLSAVEGPLPMGFVACDAVKNCQTQMRSPKVDRTAPVLTLWGAALPPFTNGASFTAAFEASDGAGAGVGAVKLKLGASSYSASFSSGRWVFAQVPLPATGSATLVVWAEDLATAPNSGEGRGVPAELSHTFRIDRSPPAAVPAPLPSYFDERTMDFARQPNGEPVIPVVYTFPSGQQPVTVSPGMTVYKSGTRLSLSDGNVPTLHYGVPFDAAQDAPVSAVLRWSTAHCQPGSCVVEFPLQSDTARVVPGNVFFKLPLSRESLEGRTGPQTLTVVFRDAAGNETTRSDAITWTVVRPPVAVAEDAAWTAAGDPKSVFAYRIPANSYAGLFGPNSNFANHGSARMVRYVVKNPAPYEVAVNLELVAGAQSIKETWGNQRVDLYARDGSGTFTVDGLSFPRFAVWDDNDPTQCTDGTPAPPGCASSAIAVGCFPWHRRGSGTPFECGVPSMLTAADVSWPTLTGGVGIHGFHNPLPSGNEATSATPYLDPAVGATRGAIVPAAAGGVAGAVVFYLEVSLPPSRAEPLQWQALPEDPALKYQYHRGDLFLFDSQGFSCGSGVYTARHHAWRWNRFLTAATSNVNGTFQVKTGAPLVQGLSGPKSPQFGTAVFGNPITFNRSFSH